MAKDASYKTMQNYKFLFFMKVDGKVNYEYATFKKVGYSSESGSIANFLSPKRHPNAESVIEFLTVVMGTKGDYAINVVGEKRMIKSVNEIEENKAYLLVCETDAFDRFVESAISEADKEDKKDKKELPSIALDKLHRFCIISIDEIMKGYFDKPKPGKLF